jgi:hypothetical protein
MTAKLQGEPEQWSRGCPRSARAGLDPNGAIFAVETFVGDLTEAGEKNWGQPRLSSYFEPEQCAWSTCRSYAYQEEGKGEDQSVVAYRGSIGS